MLTTTSCGHQFCERCVCLALQRSADTACPMCRARVTTLAVHDDSGNTRTWQVMRTTREQRVAPARRGNGGLNYFALYILGFIGMLSFTWLYGSSEYSDAHVHRLPGRSCMVGGAQCFYSESPTAAGISCNGDSSVP